MSEDASGGYRKRAGCKCEYCAALPPPDERQTGLREALHKALDYLGGDGHDRPGDLSIVAAKATLRAALSVAPVPAQDCTVDESQPNWCSTHHSWFHPARALGLRAQDEGEPEQDAKSR